MKREEFLRLIEGKVVAGEGSEEREVNRVFASDLMSDVLTIKNANQLMLMTGLCNLQTIRTCEMAEVKVILFVRGKKVTEEMKELAEENEMLLIETDYSLYRCSGILYQAGLQPLY
ncbi:MAG: hypothetical protein J6S82_03580 [Bacteroidales bacterium]|nr:hypothetical protein [Bacteroidales bacterium]